MTTDLWMLAAAALLSWGLIMAEATPGILKYGMVWASGNREDPVPEPTGWWLRLRRCSANMQENLPLFAILVLVAHVSGEADATSALGAQIFVGARLLHAATYIAGLPYLRTAIWGVSVVGMGMIATSLM